MILISAVLCLDKVIVVSWCVISNDGEVTLSKERRAAWTFSKILLFYHHTLVNILCHKCIKWQHYLSNFVQLLDLT